MKRTFIVAIALELGNSVALAQMVEDSSLSSKAANDLLRSSAAGKTFNATAKRFESSISGKAMHDHPGNR